MKQPRVTLEQWQSLAAVVEHGSYARAAEALHKSQSSVTYAVQKLEAQLGVKAFEIQGRKAVLTQTGELLYRRARALLEDAAGLEKVAKLVSAGWEAELRIAAEIIFPYGLLLQSLERFGRESPHTRIEVFESVLGGTTEALVTGKVDLAIGNDIPPGFEGEELIRMRMILAAHPEHPLHGLGRPLGPRDLRSARQLIVRESDTRRARPLDHETSRRWTFGHMATSIMAATMGFGFGRYPEDKIRGELHQGSLRPLPLRDGGERTATLHLVYPKRDDLGPGARRLIEILKEDTAQACAGAKP
jgi:DNA-binding transcriptional LysR family regulator